MQHVALQGMQWSCCFARIIALPSMLGGMIIHIVFSHVVGGEFLLTPCKTCYLAVWCLS